MEEFFEGAEDDFYAGTGLGAGGTGEMVDGCLGHGVSLFFCSGENFGVNQSTGALHFDMIEDFSAV